MEKRINSKSANNDRFKEGLEEILKKSSRLISRVGFHGASMRDLSRATDRSLSGLYHYFGSKEDLLFLINYHGFTTLIDTWKKMATSFGSPAEKLYGFIYLHTQYYVANMDEMRVMNWGTQDLAYDKAMTIKKLKDQHTADARKIIKELYKSVAGESLSPKQLARQTFLLFGMMNWIFGWYSSRAHGPVEELIKDIFRTSMYGIGCTDEDLSKMNQIEKIVRESFKQNKSSTLWETAETPILKRA